MTSKNPKPKYDRLFETGIIIVIACCVIFLNVFTTSKFTALKEAAQDSVFVMDDIPISEDDEFVEQVRSYLSDTYKMIELYDENFDLIFRVQFEEDDQYQPNDIKEYKDIISRIQNTPEGQSRLIVGNSEQNFYYKWVENDRGEIRLLIVYSKVAMVQNLWVFNLVSYLIMILIFILLIKMHIHRYQDKISHYEEVTNNIASALK